MALGRSMYALLFVSISISLMSQERNHIPIGFTVVPAPDDHASYRSNRAATINPWDQNPKISYLHPSPFTEEQGSEFVSWVEGGIHALILREDFPDGICMTDEDDSTCPNEHVRIAHMRSAVCLVRSNGTLVACPSDRFRLDHSTTQDTFGPYFYNWAPQAFYDYRGELSDFVFSTHAQLPSSTNDIEVWRMDIDGTHAQQLKTDKEVTAHGCQMSPNQQLMVCEERRPSDPGGSQFALTSASGQILNGPDGRPYQIVLSGEYEEGLLMRWSPDSRFFVYFSEKMQHLGPSRVVYQRVDDLTRLGDPLRHHTIANDQEPGFYCRYSGLCGPLGTPGDMGSDYAAFSPLRLGEQHPAYVAVAVQKPLQHRGRQKFKRVLYVESLDRKKSKEIECPNDVGYPTFSPGGSLIAFLSTSRDDPRTQLFVVEWERWAKPKDCRQLTDVPKGRQVYNPRWELYSWAHN